MSDLLKAEEKNYVEEVGVVFEQTGIPRMAGRIFGYLLICDPPHQSPAQMAEALMASKSSISTMARLLMQFRLIERFTLPGVRNDFFRLPEDAFQHTIKHGIEDEIRLFRQIAEKGLLLSDEKSPGRKWLKEMQSLYGFMEKELPALLERYYREHPKDNK